MQTTKKTGEKEEKEDILAEENASLDKYVTRILQSREWRVGIHLVTSNELKGYIATDLCGVYPTMSNRGMKYILVLHDYNSNLITTRPMKSNKGAVITEAYESIYSELTAAGITPMLQYSDNKTSKELIASIKKNKLKL